MKSMSAQQVLEHLRDYIEEYPELADVPIEVEHEDGLLDPLGVTEVGVGTGCVHFIVDAAE